MIDIHIYFDAQDAYMYVSYENLTFLHDIHFTHYDGKWYFLLDTFLWT